MQKAAQENAAPQGTAQEENPVRDAEVTNEEPKKEDKE
jgi:hypothetical protein